MTTVTQNLATIQHWLQRHLPHLALPPGATETEVLALEDRIGAPLPPDIREALRCHGGQAADFFSLHDGAGVCRLLSVTELHAEVAEVEKVMERIIEAGDRVERVMVPLLRRPTGEAWTFEIHTGELTRLDFTDEPGVRHIPGLAALLEDYARRLREGQIDRALFAGL